MTKESTIASSYNSARKPAFSMFELVGQYDLRSPDREWRENHKGHDDSTAASFALLGRGDG